MTARDRLNEIEARANAATKGPWTYGGKNRIETPVIEVDEADWGGEGLSGYAIHAQQDTGAWRYADAEFMASARADVPYLIGQVRWLLDELSAAVADNEKKDAALRAVLEHVKEMEADIPHDGSNAAVNHAGRLIRRAIEEALNA